MSGALIAAVVSFAGLSPLSLPVFGMSGSYLTTGPQ